MVIDLVERGVAAHKMVARCFTVDFLEENAPVGGGDLERGASRGRYGVGV